MRVCAVRATSWQALPFAPSADHLLTPRNSALLIIDDQPVQAIREGFEVYPVVDAVGGASVESHRAGLEPG